jgi:phage tail tube protein FII
MIGTTAAIKIKMGAEGLEPSRPYQGQRIFIFLWLSPRLEQKLLSMP